MEQEEFITQTKDVGKGKSRLPTTNMWLIGEAQQQWAMLRRKYNLFTYRRSSSTKGCLTDSPPSLIKTVQSARLDANIIESHQGDSTLNQFAYVNEPFLS